MKNQYPIAFERGKLVKYLKPHKYTKKYEEYSLELYEDQTLLELIGWVEEHGGEFKNALVRHEYGGYGDDGHMELYLKIPLSEKEIEDQEKEYEKLLSEWNEWKELSKTAKDTEEAKNKATRAKALKTQENNLLAKLRKIREQQNKL
jgi:hypothetical protein